MRSLGLLIALIMPLGAYAGGFTSSGATRGVSLLPDGTLYGKSGLTLTLSSDVAASGSSKAVIINATSSLTGSDEIVEMQRAGSARWTLYQGGDTVQSGDIYAQNIQIVSGKLSNLPSTITGTCTLSSGVCTVTTNRVTANSQIMLTLNTPGGTLGYLAAKDADITAATSFVIRSYNSDHSANTSDTSTVRWYILDHQ